MVQVCSRIACRRFSRSDRRFEAAHDVVQVAAILLGRFSATLLAGMLRRPSGALVVMVDEAVRTGLDWFSDPEDSF